jgi:hypothetical protein
MEVWVDGFVNGWMSSAGVMAQAVAASAGSARIGVVAVCGAVWSRALVQRQYVASSRM